MADILIADAGSSKIDWVFISDRDKNEFYYQTKGINALFADNEEICHNFEMVKEALADDMNPSFIHYYGAGCGLPSSIDKIERNLLKNWPNAEIEVKTDLVAAGRALFLNNDGIACILGTGSNSGLYHRNNIIENIPPLGYILGDEGSGAALGKRLLNGIFKKRFSQKITDSFFKCYPENLGYFLERIYKEEKANVFLASFATFIKKHIEEPEIQEIVKCEFSDFLQINIMKYSQAEEMKVGFVGSIARQFEPILRNVVHEFNLKIGNILNYPIEGLTDFHRLQNY